jgi:hypothetical protein
LFGSVEEKLVRFDMSEYMTIDSINILRGQILTHRLSARLPILAQVQSSGY